MVLEQEDFSLGVHECTIQFRLAHWSVIYSHNKGYAVQWLEPFMCLQI